jgi:L-lysine 2,3-aminomutase
MPVEDPKRPWEQRLHEAGTRVEEDLRRVIQYINDEVVPDVRRNGSDALRAAAAELQKLAQRMEERAHQTPPAASSTPPTPTDATKP